jgi:hypothetical protein
LTVSPQAEALTAAHKAAQDRIGAATVLAAVKLWPLLSADDIDGTTQRWLTVMLRLIRRQRDASARTAADYATVYRRLVVPGAEAFVPTPLGEINEEQVTNSLLFMGPRSFRKALEEQARRDAEVARPQAPTFAAPLGVPLRAPAKAPLPTGIEEKLVASMARAAQRHAANGGRDTIDDVIRRDKRVLGWERVTGAKPCFWCAMLASRGPVYRRDSFAASDPRFTGPGNHKVHDGCGCGLRIVYDEGERVTGRAKEFQDLWISAAKGKSGAKAVLAFRRAYEGRE